MLRGRRCGQGVVVDGSGLLVVGISAGGDDDDGDDNHDEAGEGEEKF